MDYILSNAGPILAAMAVGLAVGLLYAALIHRAAVLAARPAWLLLVVVSEFWLAAILAGALILAPDQAGRWVMAIGSAVVIWIGFVLPALVVSYGFRERSASAAIGDTLHWLVVMVAQAAVLEAIGLVRP